jgi:pimeloyl-ACP methyl ester carboxylesterase
LSTAPTASADFDAEPRTRFVACQRGVHLHRMAYHEWGPERADHVVVCVHGLSRQGRDFDTLARDLLAHAKQPLRVVCPDVLGRGRSDRLADPMGYQIAGYVADMVTLLARLDAPRIDWVGTSMGGVIGLGVAALTGSPLARFVINDVGPVIEAAALARIGTYLGQPARYASLEAAADAMWAVSRGFGPHTREEWLALSAPQIVPDPEAPGTWKPHVDPAIAVPFAAVTPEAAAAGTAALWAAWDSLRLPVLLLRGADSDLLSAATARAMTLRGPKARLVEFAGVGHAPTLVAAEQRAAVRDFLLD